MLVEDAFLQRDRAALGDLFDDRAVVMTAGGVRAYGREAIGRTLAESWDRQCTYVARTRQVLQARDTALVVAEALHDDAVADVAALLDELQDALTVVRAAPDTVAQLSSDQPSITTS